jgi:hypothetical protein
MKRKTTNFAKRSAENTVLLMRIRDGRSNGRGDAGDDNEGHSGRKLNVVQPITPLYTRVP